LLPLLLPLLLSLLCACVECARSFAISLISPSQCGLVVRGDTCLIGAIQRGAYVVQHVRLCGMPYGLLLHLL
jgi:hypothetical protein